MIKIQIGLGLMHKGSLEFTLTESACIVILRAEITWEISADLDTFLGCILNEAVFKKIFFDLSETAYMDSTSLGVLAYFKRNALKKGIKVSILNPTELILTNLRDVGLNKIFEIEYSDVKNNSHINPIPSSKKYSSREISALVRKTHLALINISEQNKGKFNDIVNLIDNKKESPD